jgi:type II secretory pathway pseudopilin PulG
MKIKKIEKKAQIWIETAIYTVIGLTIIAILLTVVTPQIEKSKDSGIIKQTSSVLNTLDDKILEIEQSAGNIRIVDIKLAKGKLEIDAKNDLIKYVLEDTKLELSEPGYEIKQGNLYLRTEKTGNRFNIFLTRYYNSSLNITNNDGEEARFLQAAATPYRIQIENVGDNLPSQKTHIDFNIL